MHRYFVTLVVSAVGCRSAPPPVRPVEARVADSVTCVDRVRNAAMVSAEIPIEVLACTRGEFGAPGWLVDYRVTPDLGQVDRVQQVLLDGGAVLDFESDGDHESDEARQVVSRWEVRDLDRDGVDELIQLTVSGPAETPRRVEVFRIDRDAMAVVDAGSLVLDGRCSATLSFVAEPDGAGVRMTTTRADHGIDDDSDCVPAGVHQWGIEGGWLAPLD